MGISLWRGKFNRSEGTVTLDRAAGVGEVRVEVDIASVDFGHDDMNKEARGSGILDADAHPRASYHGTLAGFVDGEPTRVDGELTLHGVTRPLVLRIAHFHCIAHPLHQRELCGVDAQASIDRAEFGIDAGRDYGFDMTVALRIQAEAVAVP
jgi:polyisoprenoid-binding protein YceI